MDAYEEQRSAASSAAEAYSIEEKQSKDTTESGPAEARESEPHIAIAQDHQEAAGAARVVAAENCYENNTAFAVNNSLDENKMN